MDVLDDIISRFTETPEDIRRRVLQNSLNCNNRHENRKRCYSCGGIAEEDFDVHFRTQITKIKGVWSTKYGVTAFMSDFEMYVVTERVMLYLADYVADKTMLDTEPPPVSRSMPTPTNKEGVRKIRI